MANRASWESGSEADVADTGASGWESPSSGDDAPRASASASAIAQSWETEHDMPGFGVEDLNDFELPDLEMSDFENDTPVNPEPSPGDVFVQHMVNLLLTRNLNSRQFSETMYLAGQAGVAEARKYGLRPNSKSGHYGRKVRSSVGIYKTDGSYSFDVPSRSRKGVGRATETCHGYPPHELIDEALCSDTDFWGKA